MALDRAQKNRWHKAQTSIDHRPRLARESANLLVLAGAYARS